MTITFGSLFAGIGGFDLGFERAGMVCKWQVEIDDYATRVLEKHWPSVHRERDIRSCGSHNLERVDVICGGFPCQDISSANMHKTGIEGQQSGLWSEYLRVICQVRPKVVVIENVASLVTRGLQTVLADLARIGFDVGWRVFCSAEFGFPFMRRRLFMVACPNGNRKPIMSIHAKVEGMPRAAKDSWERTLREVARSPRVADGVPNRTHRTSGIGNAVIPKIAEWIGKQVVESLK